MINNNDIESWLLNKKLLNLIMKFKRTNNIFIKVESKTIDKFFSLSSNLLYFSGALLDIIPINAVEYEEETELEFVWKAGLQN